MEVFTTSPEETESFGEEIANKLVGKRQKSRRGALILALVGNLGSGKTTFVKGFAKGLGIEQRIISPTFILLRVYPISDSYLKKSYHTFYHLDLYRLEGNLKDEMDNMGLKEIWEDDKAIVLVEWAEKVKGYLPEDTIWVNFEMFKKDKRQITVNC